MRTSIHMPACSRTPLHLAVLAHGDPGILKLLIDAGADVSTINRVLHGITPLHTAAHHGRCVCGLSACIPYRSL